MDANSEHPAESFEWRMWEEVIASNGITIDRPQGARHPEHPDIIYPIDYGYINGTTGSDGHEIDVFCGSAAVAAREPEDAQRDYSEKISDRRESDSMRRLGGLNDTLQGAIFTTDHRKDDRELKFLYRCTPRDIYLVNGFINFDRRLMEGALILRRPMHELWDGR